MESNALLTLEGVAGGYGSTRVLRNIALSVREGGITCVLGRNGVGKTTLLKTIMGLLKATAGVMRFRQQAITAVPIHARARAGIGYVPQGREVLPHLTVEENLRLGTVAKTGGVTDLPDDIFVYFPMLRAMLKRKAGMLSGGQQQQLAIARAMVANPTLMLLDEPTEGIQPNIVAEIQEIIVRLNREKKISMLLVEQKLAFARRVSSHYYIMEKGTFVADGPMETFNEGLIKAHLEVG